MSDLERLAELTRGRTAIDEQIAALLGRSAERGYTAEYIAANIFDIRIEQSASQCGGEGVFNTGPLAGRSVKIVWHGRYIGLLAAHPKWHSDTYLVLTGPNNAPIIARGVPSPWVISAVYLFDVALLIEQLRQRGVKAGLATEVASDLWQQAEIYPNAANPMLRLTPEQRDQLALFAPVEPSA